MNSKCYIHGLGSYVPPNILSNRDLESMVETSDEWITTRTGIKNRHILSEGENCSDAATKAALAALADAGEAPINLTHILVATCTADYLSPSAACQVAGNLGLTSHSEGDGSPRPVMSMDLNAACSGFVYGLELARALCALHSDAVILLIGAEALSRKMNYKDRSTCVLFGDGAGAVIIKTAPQGAKWSLEDSSCLSNGCLHHLITIGGGSRNRVQVGDALGEDHFVYMNGKEVYRQAVRTMTEESKNMLARNGLDISDLDLFIPHQANIRIIEGVGKRLEVPDDKVFVNVQNYGNTSSATLPIALNDARAQGKLKPGQTVLLTTFGAGTTWGAALLGDPQKH